MIITRVWAMPNKYTFQVKPLLDAVLRYRGDSKAWFDPFAGFHSPADVTNDLNPQCPTQFHLEAIEFCNQLTPYFDGCIFDPPYSPTQVSRAYHDMGLQFKGKENPTGGFPQVRDAIARLVRPDGYCVSFGWNTVGMGKGRGFEPVEYLICSHGGNRNDTLVTVEQRQHPLVRAAAESRTPVAFTV